MSRRALTPVLTAVAVAVALALAAAGCGGSGSGDASGSAGGSGTTGGSAGTGSSRAGLVAAADAICRRVNNELAASQKQQKNLEPKEIVRFAPRNAALELKALVELHKLTPPASVAAQWGQILAYKRALAKELAQLGRDASSNDSAGIEALATSKRALHAKLLATASRLGFKECAQT
jgi:hypothetical protein